MPDDRAKIAQEFHARHVAGDPTASAKITELLLGPTTAYLINKYEPKLDRETLTDIATDSLIAYLGAPERFDPEKASLPHYIRVIADGDALDALRKARRRPRNFAWDVHEEDLPANNPTEEIERRVDSMTILERFGDEICTDETERAALVLLLNGEDSTAEFAQRLGLEHLSASEAEKHVVQIKDRLIKRLRRLRERLRSLP